MMTTRSPLLSATAPVVVLVSVLLWLLGPPPSPAYARPPGSAAARRAAPPPPTAAPAAPAAPDPPKPPDPDAERARALIRQAGTLLNQGDAGSAVAILQQAQRLHPDGTVSYNLGVAYAESGRHPEAAAAFSEFLVQLDGDPALQRSLLPERVLDVRQRLAAYEKTLARLRLTISAPSQPDQASPAPPRATASGQALSTTTTNWLKPGLHELRVQAAGASDYQARVQLAAGESRAMQVDLSPALAGGLALVPSEPPPPPPPVYKRWWFWAAIGSGVVLTSALIGAGATGKMDRPAPGTDLPPLDVAR